MQKKRRLYKGHHILFCGLQQIHFMSMNEFCYFFVVDFWSFFWSELNTLSENEPQELLDQNRLFCAHFEALHRTHPKLLMFFWFKCNRFFTLAEHISVLEHMQNTWIVSCKCGEKNRTLLAKFILDRCSAEHIIVLTREC